MAKKIGKLAGVEVQGVDLLTGRLLLLDPQRQRDAYERALTKAAAPIVRMAKSLAPRGGTIRRSEKGRRLNLRERIKVRKIKKLKAGEVAAVKIANAPHAQLLEFGTAQRVQKKTKRKTGAGPKKPFLAPATEAHREQVVATLGAEVERQIDRIAAGGGRGRR